MDDGGKRDGGTNPLAVPVKGSAVSEFDAGLYPEFVGLVGIAEMISVELGKRGMVLPVKSLEPFGGVGIRTGRRYFQMYIAAKVRLFMGDFWKGGVLLAKVRTESVGVLVDAIAAWCGAEVDLRGLKAISKEIAVGHIAEVYEAGPAAMVRWKWEVLKQGASAEKSHLASLVPVIKMAMETAELGGLYPFTSMMILCFSRCTGYPYSGGCPRVVSLPGGERYRVYAAGGEVVLGEGNAEEAVALVIGHLPAGCGPAVHGTAEDLGS